MAEANLSIVVELVDKATDALAQLGGKANSSLEGIRDSADQIRNSFGLLGGAIEGGLGLLVKQAADSATADAQLTTAVNAGIAAAQSDTAATDILGKQKQLLQAQLDGLNGKIKDYTDKIDAGNDSTGAMASSVDLLQQKASGLRDKLDTLSNEQKLAGQNTNDIVEKFEAAARAGVDFGFANDETVKSLTTLFRATGDVDESLKANQEAMDLARAKSIDLSSAGTLIVQAMEGNGRALKQFGINLKDGLTPAEALVELQQKLANSAQDYVNTPWGQLDVAKAKTGLLAETLGAELLPMLNKLLAALIPIIDKVTAWVEAHPKLTTAILTTVAVLGALALGIAAVAGVVSAAITVFTAASAAVAAFGIVVAALGAPILIIIAIVALLAYEVYTHWNEIIDYTSDLMLKFGAAWTNGWNNAVAFLEGVATRIYNIVNGIGSALKGVGGTVANILTGGTFGAASSLISGTLNLLPHFEQGGIVPGAPGQAVPIMAHAGERVIPANQAKSGGVTNLYFSFNGTVAGDDGIRKIITQTIQTLNRQTTLQVAGV